MNAEIPAQERRRHMHGQLALREIRIGYGDEELLHIPALDFPARKITALIGPVAAGKSTLLRHIVGLSQLTPSCWHTGAVLLDGHALPQETIEEMPGIALMPQKARLYSGSVLQNLGVDSADDPSLAWWMGLLGLQEKLRDKLDWDVGMLSLAMHRVVLLLRMLLRRPRVLLLDEPLNDVALSEEDWLLHTLRRLSGRVTTIIISHSKPHAQAVSDHVALVTGGQLAELSRTTAFFKHPSSELGRNWLETGSAWPAPDWDDDTPEPAPVEHPPVAAPRSNLGFIWINNKRLAGMHQPGLLADIGGDFHAVAQLGIDRIVTLTEAPLPLDGIDTCGIVVEHFPIDDMDVPQLQPTLALLKRLVKDYDGGANLAFHCRGGLGRTGLLLACFLMAQETLGAGAAIEKIRRLNPNYIQSQKQLAFAQAFPVHWHAAIS